MPRNPQRLTLADVANEAGVSIQTASHVMARNMSVRLAAQTRQRVLDAAERIGYRPNRLAQAMKAGKTGLVAMWMPLNRPVLNYLYAIREFQLRAKSHSYELIVSGLDDDLAYAGQGKAPSAWPVDGLIAYDAGKSVQQFRNDPQNDATPIAVIGLEQYENSDSVSWGLFEAMSRLTEAMLLKGRRNLLHVTPQWVKENYPREQRRRGYVEPLERAGLTPTLLGCREESFEAAQEAMRDYLATNNGPPDAVFCFTDTLAAGVSRALQDHGLRLPDDCDVWGYGDFPESVSCPVPLSTVRIPIVEVVDHAWSLLTRRMLDPTREPELRVLPMEIVQRGSGKL